jgi:RNA polymerase sigma factor (sigma-70 family)
MTEASPTPEPLTAPPIPAALLESARLGEPEALAALFEACFDSIYGLAARMMGDKTLAEDVVQEVFLRLHKAAATIDTSRDPRPWLRTMTANLCRDHWRSFGAKVSRKAVAVDGDLNQAPPLTNGGPTPEAQAISSQQARQVQAAIDKLPEQLREVVVLRDYEGLGHEEIATIVGASPAAVRKRYSRALSALGELLEDFWP